ncbi:acetylserotonin O-methyltransferase [Pseudonocardia sp. RS11V-5]|uniref:acetylserotonin O-methyltransferase n=1 Tax=Pseudonocardia terrae TaxID=2905831 RepID=UPI001E4EC9A8|nr:acetylserotonin O-methyltransferase [Pseudonocardia terrae]MCE3552953.1 acetylserotonin O-methyltransferase [Pseudonocardia terrae]
MGGTTSAGPTPERILGLGSAFWGSKTLLSAVELGVFGVLAAGPLPAEELRDRLGLHPRSARDFFDALVALEMLDRDAAAEPRYRNTAETDLFLVPGKPTYVGGLLEMLNARLYGFWGSLTEGLRTGRPQNEAKNGEDFFSALYADPDRLAGFLAAMSALSAGAAAAIADTFPWERHQSFCDLGTAQGMLPVQVALRHPHLRGTGVDLPPAGPIFEKFVAGHGLSSRLTFTAGDFFTDPLPPAEVYVLGHILHDWGQEAKKALLRRTYDVLPDGGAVIVYDTVIDDERRANTFGLLMSLNMLIETPDGADYTGADCQGWLAEAGFEESYVRPLAGPESMVVGLK